ncbi:MAG: hypothetical protein BGO49_10615 [Planctomycetales bacterium 71-10]|nr:MAG: hypothetical protein BGO49_10615 [Planctomycetales bacterium 71-10]
MKTRSTIRLAGAFALLASLAVPLTPARAGFSYFAGTGNYYGLTTSAMNWTQAEAEAVGLGGHLVSITSAAENAFLASTFLSVAQGQAVPYWIGLNDAASEGQFVWSSGEAVTYANWASGEPNNVGDEDYGALSWHFARGDQVSPGTWNDTPLNGTSGYGGNSNGPYFGIIELSYNPAAVPEPTSLFMAALCLSLALIATSRRGRRPSRMATAVVLAPLAACLAPASAEAGSIAIANASFEEPSGQIHGPASGWTPISNDDPANRYNPFQFWGPNAWYLGANPDTDPGVGGTGYQGIDGRSLAFAYEQDPGTGIQQTLDAFLEAGMSYTLTVAVGHRNGAEFGAPTLGSLIELLAGDTVIASSRDDIGPDAGTFRDQVAFLADSDAFADLIGVRLSIRLTTTLPFTVTYQATDWDNVRLVATAAVPEPAGIAMLAVGAIAVGIAARRRGR